jgi:hypothetical protein
MKRISLHVSGKSRHREIASNSLRDNPINDLIESIVYGGPQCQDSFSFNLSVIFTFPPMSKGCATVPFLGLL